VRIAIAAVARRSTDTVAAVEAARSGSKCADFSFFSLPLFDPNVTTILHPAAILPLCFPPLPVLSPCCRVLPVIDFAFADHFRSGAATRRRERDGDEAGRAELS
jgi:hypothetical protein